MKISTDDIPETRDVTSSRKMVRDKNFMNKLTFYVRNIQFRLIGFIA